MRNAMTVMLIVALTGLVSQAACAEDDWASGKAQGDVVEGVSELMLMLRHPSDDAVAGWPEGSELLARKVMREYGRPDESGPLELVWNYRNAFVRVIVFRDANQVGQAGLLLEAVPYRLPPGKEAALAAFGRARYDAKLGELIVCADDEAENFLGLNLADDVVQGRATPQQASAAYDRTMELLAAGKTAPYAEGLRFTSPAPGTPGPGPASSPK